MRIIAALVMALLVAGAGAVFVRAQILKSAPSPIVGPRIASPVFSPNALRPQRRQATLTVGLRESDTAHVVILDANDDEVATPYQHQTGRRLRAVWDGQLASGRRAPDGQYRFAIELRRAERTIRIPDPLVLDATPPTVESTAKPGQRIAPGLPGSAGTYAFTLSASEPVRFRLDVRQIGADGVARLIRREARPQMQTRKEMRWQADKGYLPLAKRGRWADAGSYIVGWVAQDRAGNVVAAPQVVEPGELAPATVVGVETVALTQALEPVTLFASVTLTAHRVGTTFPGPVVARAKGAPGDVKLPPATGGLYAVEIASGPWSAWAPRPVAAGSPVLVLEPLYSWQAQNPTDASLSGFPDVPPDPLVLDRPLAPGQERLIGDLGRVVAAAAAATRRRVGAITDMAVEDKGVPAGAKVLVISHAPVWTPGLLAALRRFHAAGGTIAILDSSSLTQRAQRSGGAITLDGRVRAPLAGLAPIWTVSGTATAFRAARRG